MSRRRSEPTENKEGKTTTVRGRKSKFCIFTGIYCIIADFFVVPSRKLPRRGMVRWLRDLMVYKKVQMVASSAKDLVLALKETVRYGLFLHTFAETFVPLDELIVALGGHESLSLSILNELQNNKMEGFISKVNTKSSMFLTGFKTQHTRYKFGSSYACSCLGITLWNKKQAIWNHL
uniref:uncharacterized protein LOC122589258 n=1 Tax=Erigeron canadensis TaxID=72917 RepID=UPI001CB9CD9C|nr:uncharacterized protein LOC122589258 [Erigeron canadensis]